MSDKETKEGFDRVGILVNGATWSFMAGCKLAALEQATEAQTHLDRLVLKLQEERCAG